MERKIGFSTGALAFGDFERGVSLQKREGVSAIELSSLREHELQGAIDSLDLLDDSQFEYKSFHAPSRVDELDDTQLVNSLKPVADRGIPIVVHPDVIRDYKPWKKLGDLVLLENMDRRKKGFRSTHEMLGCFKELPEAKFCFDIGHARQIDPTMAVALGLLLRYASRLAEVHISEVDWDCHHSAISTASAMAFQRVAARIPEDVPIIIESVVAEEEIDAELEIVRRCLNPSKNLLASYDSQEDVVQA